MLDSLQVILPPTYTFYLLTQKSFSAVSVLLLNYINLRNKLLGSGHTHKKKAEILLTSEQQTIQPALDHTTRSEMDTLSLAF